MRAILFLTLLLAACSDPPISPSDGGNNTCPGGTLVTRVQGTVVNEGGAGMAGARAQFCLRVAVTDALVCLTPATADASGAFAVDIPMAQQCMARAAIRVLAPPAPVATTYCHVDLTPTGSVLSLPTPFTLYSTTAATSLPPLGDANTPRTVAFADGLELDVTPMNLGLGGNYDMFASRQLLATAGVPCFATATTGLIAMHGFSPEVGVNGTGFPVRIPNSTGLAAGTSVQLLVLGGLDTHLQDGTLVEEANFQPYGFGTVTADGRFIASNAGSELTYLSWLGYRLVQP